MPHKKMHTNEFHIDDALVKQLLRAQFLLWSELPIKFVQSSGTDHAIYRLGNNMCVRLPRRESAANDIEKEQQCLSKFSKHLPLEIPMPLGSGIPAEYYPWPWSVYSWLDGETAASKNISDSSESVGSLAAFLMALQKMDTMDAPIARRGLPLVTQDQEMRVAIKSLQGADATLITKLWEESLSAPAWNKSPVWIHGDLLPTNLLVQHGQLSGVIDFGLCGIGDSACDLIPAWSVFSSRTRKLFRESLMVDDATWLRGRGWALSIACIIIPYYQHTNSGITAVAERMIGEILVDV